MLSIRMVAAGAALMLLSGLTGGGALAQTATDQAPGKPLQLLQWSHTTAQSSEPKARPRAKIAERKITHTATNARSTGGRRWRRQKRRRRPPSGRRSMPWRLIRRRLRQRWSRSRRQHRRPPTQSRVNSSSPARPCRSLHPIRSMNSTSPRRVRRPLPTTPCRPLLRRPCRQQTMFPRQRRNRIRLRRHGRIYQRAKWAAPRGSRKCWRRSAARSRRGPQPGS